MTISDQHKGLVINSSTRGEYHNSHNNHCITLHIQVAGRVQEEATRTRAPASHTTPGVARAGHPLSSEPGRRGNQGSVGLLFIITAHMQA